MRPWRLSGWTRFILSTCAKCGMCAEVCQPYLVSGVGEAIPSGKGKLVLLASRGRVSDKLSAIYEYCSLCGACEFRCPFGIQMPRAWFEARAEAFRRGMAPPAVKALAKRLRETSNPYGADNEMRAEWAEFYGVDAKVGAGADLVYFVGCTSSFKSACQSVAASFASILNATGANWTLLGESEVCCGAPSLMAGDVQLAEEGARKNVEAIKATGAKAAVTTCPACYRMLKWAYPKILGAPLGFRVLHAVEYLAEAVREGKVKLSKLDVPVTYHDPCELTRLSGLGAEPRLVISKAADLREMSRKGAEAACCGGGGLLTASNPELRLEIAKRRVAEALETGAEALVSACPSCKLTLSDGARTLESKIRVVDIVEFAAEAAGASS